MNDLMNDRRAKTAIVAAICLIAVIAAAIMGWNMGGRSIDVRASAEYQVRTKELRRAETALTESQQDIDDRNTQLNETDDAIGKTEREMERYQDFAKEFGPSAGDANPQITVKSIGAVDAAYGYYKIPIIVHNNTSATLTYYEVRYQLTDDAGNITNCHFANSVNGCAGNADCTFMGYGRFNPAGMTLTPISWTTGSAENSYGHYGTDVVTRKF